MKMLTLLASALVATLSSSMIAQAACTQAHMNNKSWKLTAKDVQGALIFCEFRTSRAGLIAGNATGCKYNTMEVDSDFTNPNPLVIFDGSITMDADDTCTYDVTLRLDNAGTSVIKARVVFESGKTIANGNYLLSSSEGAGRPISGGTISMMKQARR